MTFMYSAPLAEGTLLGQQTHFVGGMFGQLMLRCLYVFGDPYILYGFPVFVTQACILHHALEYLYKAENFSDPILNCVLVSCVFLDNRHS